jgi:hypothetical protein
MGLFSSITSVAKKVGTTTTGILKQAKNDLVGGLDLLSAVASHPIKTTSAFASFVVKPSTTTAQNINKVVQQTIKEGPLKTSVNTVINTVAAAAVLTSSAALLGSKTVAKVGSVVINVVKAHPIETITAPLTVPLVSNAITSNPDIIKKIAKLPEDSGNLGTDIGKLSKDLTIDNGVQFLKDHPYASSGAAIAVLLSLGYSSITAASIWQNYQNTKAIKKNTEATKDIITADLPNLGSGSNLTAGGSPNASTINIYTAPVPNTQSPAENLGTTATAAVPVSKPAVATKKKSIKKKKVIKKKKKKVIKKKKVYKKKKTTKKRRKIKKRK